MTELSSKDNMGKIGTLQKVCWAMLVIDVLKTFSGLRYGAPTSYNWTDYAGQIILHQFLFMVGYGGLTTVVFFISAVKLNKENNKQWKILLYTSLVIYVSTFVLTLIIR